jgi:cell volume regulation protein A
MSEIADFAHLLLPIAGALALAIAATTLADRLPVPAPAVFLVTAALASDWIPALDDALSVRDVERIAVVALIVILLNGGMDIGWKRMRGSLGPVLSLGVIGTFVTAALIALAAHALFGFSWILSGVLGAALAPTDPAVVFSVLAGREIEGRSGTVLEGEAGVNDPAGIALMLGMVELATHAHATFLVVVKDFAIEMSVGLACGAAGALVLVAAVKRLKLAAEDLFPVLVIVLAVSVYALTSLSHGSGFLAVFVAGLLLGDVAHPQKATVDRFQSSLAQVSELTVFIALGLTIGITDLSLETWLEGLALAAFLAAVARPISVLTTLTAFGLRRNELLFVTWSGLKGAVPILLAAFAVIGDVQGAPSIYGLVFVVVLLSVVIQGTFLPAVARRLAVLTH